MFKCENKIAPFICYTAHPKFHLVIGETICIFLFIFFLFYLFIFFAGGGGGSGGGGGAQTAEI